MPAKTEVKPAVPAVATATVQPQPATNKAATPAKPVNKPFEMPKDAHELIRRLGKLERTLGGAITFNPMTMSAFQ